MGKKLKVYYWSVCPHCHAAMEWLKRKGIPFEAIDIETAPQETVDEVIRVNGGEDWVVPTMEYNGKWRPGEVFDEARLESDMRAWGLLPEAHL